MPDEKIIDPKVEDGDFNLDTKNKNIEGTNSDSKEKESIIFAPEKDSQKEMSAVEKDSTYSQILSKISQQSSNMIGDDVRSDAQVVSKKMDAESQIQHLVELATTKGVVHAVKVARHLDDNYVLDMLHDKMISEELHKVLVENNFISPE